MKLLLFLTAVQLLGYIANFIRHPDSPSSPRKGDFPAYYSAALLVGSGQASRLYDFDLQREIQNHYWPTLEGSIHPFVYPPFVAAELGPLANVSPDLAVLFFTGFMCTCLCLAVRTFLPYQPLFEGNYVVALGASVLFAPIMAGVFGGQNTGLSLLCYGMIVLSLHDKSNVTLRNRIVAAVALGAWSFKPHFAAIAAVVLLIIGEWKVVVGAATVSATIFGLSLIVVPIETWAQWIAVLPEFAELELSHNFHQMVSINGITHAIVSSLLGNSGHSIALAAALGCWLLALASFAYVLWQQRANRDALFLIGPAIVLLSPHTMYYDLGLAFAPVVRFVRISSDVGATLIAGVYLLALYGASSRHFLMVSPLSLLAVGSALYVLTRLQTPAGKA